MQLEGYHEVRVLGHDTSEPIQCQRKWLFHEASNPILPCPLINQQNCRTVIGIEATYTLQQK